MKFLNKKAEELSIKEIISLLQFRKPREAKIVEDEDSYNWGYPQCPTCTAIITMDHVNFCINCGQKLKWTNYYKFQRKIEEEKYSSIENRRSLTEAERIEKKIKKHFAAKRRQELKEYVESLIFSEPSETKKTTTVFSSPKFKINKIFKQINIKNPKTRKYIKRLMILINENKKVDFKYFIEIIAQENNTTSKAIIKNLNNQFNKIQYSEEYLEFFGRECNEIILFLWKLNKISII